MKKELLYLDILFLFALLGQFLIYAKIVTWINLPGILGYFLGLAVYTGDLFMYFKIQDKVKTEM